VTRSGLDVWCDIESIGCQNARKLPCRGQVDDTSGDVFESLLLISEAKR
jgi:hypothetical protein